MTESESAKAVREGFHTAFGLAVAINEAGGMVSREMTAKLSEMSVVDFCVEIAARNGIRFVYVLWEVRNGSQGSGPPGTLPDGGTRRAEDVSDLQDEAGDG